MDIIKIVYISRFSTPKIRRHLLLKSFFWGNLMRKVWGKSQLYYNDVGTWNADFVRTFEYSSVFECHVVSHHLGLRKKEQSFIMDGVYYHILQEKEKLLWKVMKTIFNIKTVSDFSFSSAQILKVVEEINPRLVIVCGAENPIYSSSILQINNIPVFIILQTLLNDPKRIEMGIGDAFRREIERQIFAHANYFGSFNLMEKDFILKQNPNARCLRIMFPFSAPEVECPKKKEYDFVFYANQLSKNKGAEDALMAFVNLTHIYPGATLNMIGNCDDSYKQHLNSLIQSHDLKGKVVFHAHFPKKIDVINQVLKSRMAVLPSITAPLNSTVREVMALGIPVIVYETSATLVINTPQMHLLTAKMEDISDLEQKMLYAYEHQDEMKEMAQRAVIFAEKTFAPKAVSKTLESEIIAIIDNYYYQKSIPEGLKL